MKEARIEISTYCNNRCIFCPHSNGFKRKKEHMSFELFKFILEKLMKERPNYDYITLSGMGEASINPEINDMIDYAFDRGYKIQILSNGVCIDKVDTDKLYLIRVSLNSIDRNRYNKITGTNNYDKMINNINRLLKEGKGEKLFLSGIYSENEDMEKMIELFHDKCFLEIGKLHNGVNKFNYRKTKRIRNTCGRPFNGPLEIFVNGEVHACCFDYEGDLTIGDLKYQSFDDIFSSERYKEIYKYHKDGNIDESNLICKECDQLTDKTDILYYSNRGIESPEERVDKTSTILGSLCE